MRRLALIAALLGSGCGNAAGDKAAMCEMAAEQSAVTTVDRKVLGEAAPYPADLALAAREAELAGSMRARRELAWQVVARTLAPVEIAETRLAAPDGTLPQVPRFRTWYGADDFSRMFKQLYADLGTEGRQARAPFGDAALAAIFPWNVTALDGLPSWPEERYLDYLMAIDEPIEVAGLGGTSRVAYSPAAMRHIYEGWAHELSCLAAPETPASAGGTVVAGAPVAAVEHGTLAGCGLAEYGPYFVADGAAFQVTLTGDADVDLYVRRGARPSSVEHDCASQSDGGDEACAVVGPGPVYVAVQGFAASSQYELELAYVEADSENFAPCQAKEFPADAAMVKAHWQRAQFGQTLPVYDTSGERMAVRLREGGAGEWGPGDGQAVPAADAIYTVRLENGNEYRMPAMHIMTKELRHWVWITLWWSPEPDTDFGADRPAFLQAMGPPWNQYKMCVVTSFSEADADPAGGYAQDFPSLAAALAATHDGAGGPSWCSNPYLEEGKHNARSSCIGCHQHAGTKLLADEILADYPHAGRTKVRDNFPSDYLWSLSFGDDLAQIMQDEVDYYDAFE